MEFHLWAFNRNFSSNVPSLNPDDEHVHESTKKDNFMFCQAPPDQQLELSP